MNETKVRSIIMPLTGGTSSCKITASPLAERASARFWRAGRKHKRVGGRNRRLLEAYFQVASSVGSPFYGTGIPLKDGKFLVADKAVMATVLHHRVVGWNSGTSAFELRSS
jgi:hypothetical protein